MEYRLPKLEDKELVKSYIEDHYSHNEKSLSASNMLTSMTWENWVKKTNDNAIIEIINFLFELYINFLQYHIF